MAPIKDFQLIYEALNEEDTFSGGDTVNGTVTFTLMEETKVKSIYVKVKGDADVHWTEGSGEDKELYSATKRYFKVKEYLVAKDTEDSILPEGVHCFKFSLKIPEGDMPSPFKGFHGQIAYMLKAKLSGNRWGSSRVQKELKFVSKSFSHHGLCPQSGSVDKELGVFSKGQVQMSATVDRKVCSPGDTLSIVAKICNSSSKKMKPKFRLRQKVVYRARGSTKTSDLSLCKMVGDTIASNSEETVSCQLKIPANAGHTIQNCEILSVDYCIKVYLDISFAIDPEVVFPLVIVPSSIASLHNGEPIEPYPVGAVGAPSYSDFPPPVSAGPDTYGFPAPDPTQQANIRSGFNNQ